MQRGAAPQVDTTRGETTPTRPATSAPAAGLDFVRYFSHEGIDPFDEVEWDVRSAVIGNEKGQVVFEQRNVEMPRFWSQQATNIVVSKSFREQMETPERERSVKQLIGRVVDTITEWARKQSYFASEDDLQAFSDNLKHLLVYQKAAFNSPVWFNVGFESPPMLGLLHQRRAGHDGVDPRAGQDRGHAVQVQDPAPVRISSNIRSSRELLAGGGTASGPVSFMKGFDAFARRQVGGKTRRAAKMVIAQRRPSRYRGLHRLQDQGGEEGVGAHRRRLRRRTLTRMRPTGRDSRTRTTPCA